MIDELIVKLTELEVSFNKKEQGIAIPLQEGFGVLEFYELPENDDILLLAGEDWHTHSSVENGIEGIAKLILDILQNKYLLVIEVTDEGVKRRRIEPNTSEYLKWLPKGCTYEICNKA